MASPQPLHDGTRPRKAGHTNDRALDNAGPNQLLWNTPPNWGPAPPICSHFMPQSVEFSDPVHEAVFRGVDRCGQAALDAADACHACGGTKGLTRRQSHHGPPRTGSLTLATRLSMPSLCN